jgi:hypothetical protein
MKKLFYLENMGGDENVMGLYNNVVVQFDKDTWDSITKNRQSSIIFIVPSAAKGGRYHLAEL